MSVTYNPVALIKFYFCNEEPVLDDILKTMKLTGNVLIGSFVSRV